VKFSAAWQTAAYGSFRVGSEAAAIIARTKPRVPTSRSWWARLFTATSTGGGGL
jgi:hypothetical protein